MKSVWKKWMIALVVILLYLVILVIGGVLISYYPVAKQSNYTIREAANIASATADNLEDMVINVETANIYVILYDAQGNVVRYDTPQTNLYGNDAPNWKIEKQLAVVLSGKSVTRVNFAWLSGRRFPDFLLVSGSPVVKDGIVTGAAFVGKNLMDVPYSIIGYLTYFTICYWITASVILYIRRRKKRLDQLEKNYVANMTHALKTPIASIKALAETLCDRVEPDPDKRQLYCGMILKETNEQQHMVQNLLDLSKLQSRSVRLPSEKVKVQDLLEPIWEKYELLVEYAGITLHKPERLEQLPQIYTNPGYIQQVLEVFFDNAVKFVPEGGDIWVNVAVGKRKVTVCVRDNGCGISPEDLPHVFDRFYKSNLNKNPTGNGLGLAIAKEICDHLQEKIWVESAPNQGAAFYFTLKQA